MLARLSRSQTARSAAPRLPALRCELNQDETSPFEAVSQRTSNKRPIAKPSWVAVGTSPITATWPGKAASMMPRMGWL